MLPAGRVAQRRVLAAFTAFLIGAVPVTAAAEAEPAHPDVDTLWNQPQGVRVDSAFYVVQRWWDSLSRVTQNDPTQRGFDELAQANADLLNAYTLLQEQRTNPGPHPVAIVDPLLSGIYNFVTGSQSKAPLGSIFHWANQSLLKLEGRGSTETMVRDLLKDYQIRQAAAERDLHAKPGSDIEALWRANAGRETALLAKLRNLTTPGDGLTAVLDEADHTMTALAARHPGKDGKDTAKTTAGKNQGGSPNGQGPKKK